jgi:exopolyphosphatase/guanosine-5'-triphosphate,3'-diphosphate pyrophosphatase
MLPFLYTVAKGELIVPRRVSAIDIGSNAIRMMVADIHPETQKIEVLKRYRAAVRLGHDVFTQGLITAESIEFAKATFHAYSHTNKELGVTMCRAVATSACREAKNRDQFVKEIKKSSGIDIEVIDGTVEGKLIHLAVTRELELEGRKTMLIDVGGGSVEVTFSKGSEMLSTKSFPMGTVRMLETLTKRNLNESHLNILMGEFLEDLGGHIYKNVDHDPVHFAIGTGGNLEALGKMKVQLLQKNPHTFLTLAELTEIIERLRPIKLKDRIEVLKMRKDRADVIVPAAVLVQTIMRQAETEKILIPSVGLRDGLIYSMLPSRR